MFLHHKNITFIYSADRAALAAADLIAALIYPNTEASLAKIG